MDKVRIGIIGMGGMGTNHANSLIADKVPNAELTAVCDIRTEMKICFMRSSRRK
ncbi:hypothetical protein [Metabacillus halosaccharovorans]|uniref:hypothetical protein n=2 Tax=Metabacillus halosaccharovorans TaxID=930124 RepID=UPI003736909F